MTTPEHTAVDPPVLSEFDYEHLSEAPEYTGLATPSGSPPPSPTRSEAERMKAEMGSELLSPGTSVHAVPIKPGDAPDYEAKDDPDMYDGVHFMAGRKVPKPSVDVGSDDDQRTSHLDQDTTHVAHHLHITAPSGVPDLPAVEKDAGDTDTDIDEKFTDPESEGGFKASTVGSEREQQLAQLRALKDTEEQAQAKAVQDVIGMISPSKQETMVAKLRNLQRKQGTEEEKEAIQGVMEMLSPRKQATLKRDKPGIWARIVGTMKGVGKALFGGAQDQVDEKDMQDMGPAAAFQNVQLPVAPPMAVALPTNPLMTFRPTPAPTYDQGTEGTLFHQSFLKKGGVRTTIAVSGGTIILRPAELTVNITRVSRGTRQEVARFLSGRFPLGAKIDGQLYTSAVLVETVLSRLPGTVKISY